MNKLIYEEYFGVSSVLVIYDFLILSKHNLLTGAIFLCDTTAISEARRLLPGSPRKSFSFCSDSVPICEHFVYLP